MKKTKKALLILALLGLFLVAVTGCIASAGGYNPNYGYGGYYNYGYAQPYGYGYNNSNYDYGYAQSYGHKIRPAEKVVRGGRWVGVRIGNKFYPQYFRPSDDRMPRYNNYYSY